MEILLINGSPKGKRSNSLRLAEKFLQGFKAGMKASEGEFSVEDLYIFCEVVLVLVALIPINEV